MSQPATAPEKEPENKPALVVEQPKKKRPIGVILLAIVVILGGSYAVRMYLYNSTHVTTDDAYVTTDVVPVNPLVNGNIVSVPVSENQNVAQGQLLAQIDDTTFRADVDQAKANLAMAIANDKSANADLSLTTETGHAQESEAQGVVTAGGSDITTALANVGKADSAVATAKATLSASDAQARAADDGVQTALQDRNRVAAQLTGAHDAVINAQAGVKVAQANLANAQATLDNANRDAARYRNLANQGAVPVSEAELKETAAANAAAAVDAARQQVAAAEANVRQRQSDYVAAQEQVKLADTAVLAARSQAGAAHQSASAQATRVTQARSDVVAAEETVKATQARQRQNVGKLNEAQALPKRVSMSEAAKQLAIAKVDQAKAALETAEIALARTRITAPVAGKVTRKTVELGQQVTPGQPIMSLIPVEAPWVTANFKETQLGDIRPGQRVEIEVDAIPGRTFIGHVDSISPGTGSTFALLPPDNSTGNFTKVVQRVPVKITIDPGQPDIDRLDAGLSVNAAVVVK